MSYCEICGRINPDSGTSFHDTILHRLHDSIEALEQRCSDLERVVAAQVETEPRTWMGPRAPDWWSRVVEGKPIKFTFENRPHDVVKISVEPREP